MTRDVITAAESLLHLEFLVDRTTNRHSADHDELPAEYRLENTTRPYSFRTNQTPPTSVSQVAIVLAVVLFALGLLAITKPSDKAATTVPNKRPATPSLLATTATQQKPATTTRATSSTRVQPSTVRTSAANLAPGNAARPFPENVVAVYYMVFPEAPTLNADQVPAGVNVINLSFLVGDPPALPGFGSQGREAFLQNIQRLRARGIRIIASAGGQGKYINVANRQGFIDGVMAVNEVVPLDGLDWDVEGHPFTEADVVAISAELKRLRGKGFSITLAPNGSNIEQYVPVAVALQREGLLDMIGQQFYDSPVAKEQALSRLDQLRAAGIPENRIGIGMMVGEEDIYWTVAECVENVRHLKAKYPALRGMYLWEGNRPGTAEWVASVGALA